MNTAHEVNFDGLVGPSHNYAGLALGNMASHQHAYQVSHPKQAALQGIQKMRLLMNLGLPQCVLPPHYRPALETLKNLGFTGAPCEILNKAYRRQPEIFAACYSASSMWTANSATVSPSADTGDGRVHFTIANLVSHLHRSLEAPFSYQVFKKVFSNSRHFVVHEPLAASMQLSDEGAANHNRVCSSYEQAGVECFVYGKSAFHSSSHAPVRYPARQTKEACEAIARLHGIPENCILFLQQNPATIDQGVFHNDVISVANKNVFFYHEEAFVDTAASLQLLQQKFGEGLHLIPVSTSQLSIKEAVSSYLFNSQLVTLRSGNMALIAPTECESSSAVQKVLQEVVSQDNPITDLHYINCRESMQNGGGPACLRLRVVLNEPEWQALKQETAITMNEEKLIVLEKWIDKHYRDSLSLDDLCDATLITETQSALDELTQILELGSIYSFQQLENHTDHE